MGKDVIIACDFDNAKKILWNSWINFRIKSRT